MEEKNRIGYGGGTHLADTELPAEFLLLPYGEIHYTRNGENGSFQFPETAADTVIADFEVRGKDLVIDYEHQSLGGCKAPAAGWIDRLFKTEQGLHAHVKYWTAEAAEYLVSRRAFISARIRRPCGGGGAFGGDRSNTGTRGRIRRHHTGLCAQRQGGRL